MLFDRRPIFLAIGGLLAMLGLFMFVPAILDLAYDNQDWEVFALSACLTLFIGIALVLANYGQGGSLSIQQAFILTSATWLVMPAFAALPFAFSGLNMSYTDSFFESMSGLTTTGSTVMSGLDYAPPGILLWRSLLQWLGGVGIIVMAVAILPMLQVGGMQLFKMESSDTSDKIMPRMTQVAGGITIVYIVITVACMLSYWLAGMTPFDAINHAMTTVATGGLSTHDASFNHFKSGLLDTIACIFMLAGSLPFTLYLSVVRGNSMALWRDSQVRFYVSGLVVVIVMVTTYQWFYNINTGWEALRYSSFNVIAVVTGTGYALDDYTTWGAFSVMLFFFLTFAGGCTGSATGGIKMYRFQVLLIGLSVQVQKMIRPHGVFLPQYKGRPLPESVMSSVMSFLSMFIALYVVLAILLTLIGLDATTALSGAATAMANVGPGLGDIIGPSGNFSSLPDSAKWLLSVGMMLGRLELFTVLILFLPSFWRA